MEVAGTQAHPSGDVVVKQGDDGSAFFIVSDGTLEVLVDDRPVAKLERGAFFGEIAALLGEVRSATFRATSPVTLLRFEMPKVNGIIHDYPPIRQVLVKLALKRSEDNLSGSMKHDFA